MSLLRVPDERRWDEDLTSLVAGALFGLTAGFLVSRVLREPRAFGDEFQERARTAVRRLRPARLRRLAVEQWELDRLEKRVLDAFLEDPVLAERAVDIGAISPGIIELSGMVNSEDEAERAVAVANRIAEVRTVVNRLEVGGSARKPDLRKRLDPEDLNATFDHQESRVGGMGRRRQGAETDPERPDESQQMREDALAAADRAQWEEEGYVTASGRAGGSPELRPPEPTNYDETELDNQDPHGKHAPRTLDVPPEELRSESRVGEPPKPGTQRAIEESGLDPEAGRA